MDKSDLEFLAIMAVYGLAWYAFSSLGIEAQSILFAFLAASIHVDHTTLLLRREKKPPQKRQ